MKKRILNYHNMIESILSENSPKTDWNYIEKDLLIQIGFFQHERLIHLIVTVTFAILEIISISLAILTDNVATIFLSLAVLCLLIPYIKHYYLLENEVQKMYEFYDLVEKKIKDF